MSEHTLTVLVVLDDPDVRTVIHCKDNASAGGRGGGGDRLCVFTAYLIVTSIHFSVTTSLTLLFPLFLVLFFALVPLF